MTRAWVLIVLLATAAACRAGGPAARLPEPAATSTATAAAPAPTATAEPASSATQVPALAEDTATLEPAEPEGCLRPPDDRDRLEVNGRTLNGRTLAMLEHAASLYGGEIDVTGRAITQGSYTGDEPLSFGTHSGGGAIDLSVVRLPEWTILWGELEPLIRALRVAGFAAWVRQPDELAPSSPIHIHAIAVGDPELSPAAEAQLTGEFGYFRGYNGLPQANGNPVVDAHGGPVVCNWMTALGYRDLRAEP